MAGVMRMGVGSGFETCSVRRQTNSGRFQEQPSRRAPRVCRYAATRGQVLLRAVYGGSYPPSSAVAPDVTILFVLWD
jgi:hypothetical protein